MMITNVIIIAYKIVSPNSEKLLKFYLSHLTDISKSTS